MFAKYITRLKLRRIVRKLQKQRALMKQELVSESQSEHGHQDASEPDIQYKTYMFGGNLSEWEGTTKWEVGR